MFEIRETKGETVAPRRLPEMTVYNPSPYRLFPLGFDPATGTAGTSSVL